MPRMMACLLHLRDDLPNKPIVHHRWSLHQTPVTAVRAVTGLHVQCCNLAMQDMASTWLTLVSGPVCCMAQGTKAGACR